MASAPEKPVIEARYDASARAWIVRTPWSGWTQVRGVWTEDEAAAAVRRLYGPHVTKGARIVCVPSKKDERERTSNPLSAGTGSHLDAKG